MGRRKTFAGKAGVRPHLSLLQNEPGPDSREGGGASPCCPGAEMEVMRSPGPRRAHGREHRRHTTYRTSSRGGWMNPRSPATAIQRLKGGGPSSQTGENGTGLQTAQRDPSEEATGGGGGHTEPTKL